MSVTYRIPHFIKAKSPDTLRRLMLANNAKYGQFFDYKNIQFANGEWVAWFYRDLTMDEVFEAEKLEVKKKG